ncbi:MAG: hypothetical protein KKC51_06525 [Verrucomicrobia bacterium]|nr:hypothetical protein [Verrucomicrobiota bacterium]
MKKQSTLVLCLIGLLCVLTAVLEALGKHCGSDKKPYDPDTQGCCINPDGTGKVTDKPENTNPCTLNEVQEDLCKMSSAFGNKVCAQYGRTVCYNGKKVGCVCNCMGIQNAALLACIQAHEDEHAKDDNLKCADCDTKKPTPQDQNIDAQNHCVLYKKDRDCAKAIPGWEDNPEIRVFVENAIFLLRWNSCPE